MSAARRAVAPLLTLQAFIFVVLTVVVGALYWVERATFGAEVDGPAADIRTARVQANRAVSLPYAVAATRDESIAREARESINKAEGALERIRTEVGHLAGVHRGVDDAIKALSELKGVLATIEAANEGTRLTNAYTELATQRDALDDALARIDKPVQQALAFHYDQKIQILLVVWAAALVVSLVTGLTARRRTQANETEEDQRRAKAIDGLTRVLRQAIENEEVQLGVLPAGDQYSAVAEATSKLVTRVESLQRANKEMARSNSFLQDLQEALSLAETEHAVLQTAMRAADSAYRDLGFQLITVDPADRTVRLTNPDGPGICSFPAPEQCPALSHGRTWHHRVDDALARCPRLNEDDLCVTCAPIQVEGKPAAVAQLSGYDAQTIRFEELEALALATAVRLSVTRNIAAATNDSMTDHLTGLANRRLYEQRVGDLDLAGVPYALVMADLDHFKALNDRYGHDVGDRCLEIFAAVLKDACRDSDLPCRLGGEEFVLVLPGVGVKAGLAVAMRVRAYLADAVTRGPARYTVSLGVAARPEHGNSAEAVLRAADAALYDAKEAGRDQVVPARMHTNLEAAR